MTDEALRMAFAQDVVFLRYAGLRPVVVHGGGPQINAHLDRLGMESTFRAGLRVTTAEAMDVVRMGLTGQANRDVVGLINKHGPFAVGMSGEDAHLLTARRVGARTEDGKAVAAGHVGEVKSVMPGALTALSAGAGGGRRGQGREGGLRKGGLWEIFTDSGIGTMVLPDAEPVAAQAGGTA